MTISNISYQTLCVFLQMKDTKHTRRDIHSVTLAMPKGSSDYGVLGCPEGGGGGVVNNFFKHGLVAYHIDGDDEQNRMQVKFLS